MLCPRNDKSEEPSRLVCQNCFSDLADRVFRKKVAGGKIEPHPSWCDDAKDIGNFIDKLYERNDECYEAICQMLSCPVEVDGENYLVTVKPGLWKKGVDIVNGPYK